ncbi:S-adenosyl-L-methionine-dependent methyltransferase [Lecanosticta acicola]|uniref:S-adenosyl-L-methionine-dependent methyltransferase n=1 Tax=Lecanosticta acicola TaxID=111012 RepID=A0AAI8YP60_9PEZI|nr:S-adenosyl-L-methionine-dependent methyltransferase [Lecanosticta acicola]
MAESDREKVRSQFLDQPAESHPGHWDALWKQKVTPWDRSGPSIALKDTTTSHSDIFGSPLHSSGEKRKRAFVPGCGRGYDVLLLASLGYDTYGLDASENAIEAARKLQAESKDSETYAPQDSNVGAGKVKFMRNDFFNDDFLSDTDGGSFDLIFDYTFLCALPPELRPSWAKRMSELLSPNGHLVCLEWPLGKDPKAGGPPHGLSSDLYVQLFAHPGQAVTYDDDGFVLKKAGGEKSPGALNRIDHFMPERTHEAGKGKDYVSIWKHAKA